jgi:hypothetical protein
MLIFTRFWGELKIIVADVGLAPPRCLTKTLYPSSHGIIARTIKPHLPGETYGQHSIGFKREAIISAT